MYQDKRLAASKKKKHRFHDIGFRQRHGGREHFMGSEWGQNSEISKTNVYRESDSYDNLNAKVINFDIDKRDDDLFSREYNRSRFADSSFSEDFIGKGPKGYRRSDKRIYEDACESLFRNPTVDASDIEVKVEIGIVTLTGKVNGRTDKKEAEHCLEHIRGVIDIQNELKIVTEPDRVLS